MSVAPWSCGCHADVMRFHSADCQRFDANEHHDDNYNSTDADDGCESIQIDDDGEGDDVSGDKCCAPVGIVVVRRATNRVLGSSCLVSRLSIIVEISTDSFCAVVIQMVL